jgi:hypothetical protein
MPVRSHLLTSLVAFLMVSAGPMLAQTGSCMAIGFGDWGPRNEASDLTKSRTIMLLSQPASSSDGLLFRKGWRQAVVGDGRSASEYDQEWIWFAPTEDSLVLLRPAIMSASIYLIGAWRADTLVARSTIGSDSGTLGAAGTRANAFGIRYQCHSVEGAARALAALTVYEDADVPNPALGVVEDSILRSQMNAYRGKPQ